MDEISDEELRELTEECYADVCAAAAVQKDSEWHQACFSALFVLCEEMNNRGLRLEVPSVPH